MIAKYLPADIIPTGSCEHNEHNEHGGDLRIMLAIS